ncbi:hypothetical protein LIP30_09895 [Collinsella aerofaciens]|nr:hypothetical protein [Collinsella aerofaciens]
MTKKKSNPEKVVQGRDDEFDLEFDLIPVNMSDVLKLPIDALLDLYNDYKTLYEITKDNLFETRAKVYLSCLKVKHKVEERRRNDK